MHEILSAASWGIIVAVGSSLLAWPLSLSVVNLIHQLSDYKMTPALRNFFTFLAGLPLLIYAFIYLELVGQVAYKNLISIWSQILTSESPLTQLLAFAFTIIFYPLRLLLPIGEAPRIHVFYNEALWTIIDMAEFGFSIFITLLALTFYIIPKMVTFQLRELENTEAQISYEVVQSLGGSRWSAVDMTVLQLMRQKALWIICHFSRLAFSEGLIVYIVWRFFVTRPEVSEPFTWQTLSGEFIHELLDPLVDGTYLFIWAITFAALFVLLYLLEEHFRRSCHV